MLIIKYYQYFNLKPKDSEELILNSRLMKEVKLNKKSSFIEKQENLSKDKSSFVTELS